MIIIMMANLNLHMKHKKWIQIIGYNASQKAGSNHRLVGEEGQQSKVTPPPSKKAKRSIVGKDEVAEQPSPEDGESPSLPTLMHEGVNLLSISSGGDFKKFGLKVFSKLFTKEEMKNGMIGPIERLKTKGKIILNERKVEIMKNAINMKFGEQALLKKWSAIRQSCNQKCLDTKKHLVEMEAKTACNGDEPQLPSLSHERDDDD